MPMTWTPDSKFRDATQNILRIAVGLLFMQHGAQKVFGWIGGIDGEGASVALFSQMGLAGVIEFFGGLLLVLGLFTLPVALLALGEMLYAYFTVHFPQAFFPLANAGELALLYGATFLYFIGNGPGSFSLDAKLWGSKDEAEATSMPSASAERHGAPAL